MRAVDTNLLVRLITNDDEAQARVAEEFIAAGAWIPHIVLAEAVWVLASAFDLSRGKIAEAVDMLLNHTSLAIQDSEVVSAALANFRQYAGVEFSDCLALIACLEDPGVIAKILAHLDRHLPSAASTVPPLPARGPPRQGELELR